MTDDVQEFIDWAETQDPAFVDDLLEEICDAHWSNESTDRVSPTEKHMMDATNYIYEGFVKFDDPDDEDNVIYWNYVCESGDVRGFVMMEWYSDDDETEGRVPFTPPEPDPYILVPKFLKPSDKKFQVYLVWPTLDWFKRLESDYNYDATFSPTNKVHTHYREAAGRRGLKFARKSEANKDVLKEREKVTKA